MDSPNSTKSRSSRKNSFIEVLLPKFYNMKENCSRYREVNESLRKEMDQLRIDKRQIELEKKQNEEMYTNEILRLNELIKQLQSKVNSNETNSNQLNQLNQLNHQSNQQQQQQQPISRQLNQPNPLNAHKPANRHKHKQKQLKENDLQGLLSNKVLISNALLGGNGINDSYKQLIGVTMEDWMQRSNEKFKAEVNDKVERVKQNFLISLEQEVELIVGQLTTDHTRKKQPNLLNELNANEQYTVKISPDIKLVLKPLKVMIDSINQHFNNKKLEIVNKINELESSQRLLDNSLNRVRLADNELQNKKLIELNERIQQLEEQNQGLRLVNEQLEARNVRLYDENQKLLDDNKQLVEDETEYKERIREAEDQLEHVKFNLNKQIAELRQKNDLNFELKEQTILGKIKKDNENLVNELNDKFSELLSELKGKNDCCRF